MRKIIVVTTGGTIGSLLQAKSISVDDTQDTILNEIERAKSRSGYQIEVLSSINKHSEAFSPLDWVRILESLKSANESDAHGIVVTHGTDTLEYSVAAAVAYTNIWKKPICFTGSYYSPTHPSSDAHLNLFAAIEFVAAPNAESGVFVAFRSNILNTRARVINGFDLKPMSFDDLYVKSAYNESDGKYTFEEGISSQHYHATRCPILGVDYLPHNEDLAKIQSQIAFITLYPGIDKDLLIQVAKSRTVLIIQMYHSGTGPFGEEYKDIIEFIRESYSSVTILMGTFPKKFIDIPYDSTFALKDAGAHIYADIQAYYLYVFSVLSLSLGKDRKAILDKFSPWEI